MNAKKKVSGKKKRPVRKGDHPTDPERVRAFALFFKRYMSVSALVTAALPIPVTAFHLIPTYAALTKILSTYTPMFCFLILGYIFFSRHQLARSMFPEYFRTGPASSSIPLLKTLGITFLGTPVRVTWHAFVATLPLLLIVVSLYCVFAYHVTLADSVKTAIEGGLAGSLDKMAPTQSALQNVDLSFIPMAGTLIGYYLGIFLAAEAAFILMAIKEYLQDTVGLTDVELIEGKKQHVAQQ